MMMIITIQKMLIHTRLLITKCKSKKMITQAFFSEHFFSGYLGILFDKSSD